VHSRTTVAGRPLPAGRYGRRGAGLPKWLYWVLAAGGVLVGVVIAFVGYRTIGSAPIEAQRTAFSQVDPTAMRISFDVRRDDATKPAVCVVRVRVLDGSEGGRREVLVPPGGNPTVINTVIRSTPEPVVADVVGCSYQVPEYLSRDLRPTG
jgi:hypothetical protein